jgi:hypothetical protein
MSNLLYYYGMCNVVKDILLQRYFGKVIEWALATSFDICVSVCWTFLFEFSPQGVRGCSTEPESDIVQACRSVCAKTIHPPLPIAMYLFQFMMLNSLLIHEVSRSTAGHECVAIYSDYQWVCPFTCPMLMRSTHSWVGRINILPWFTGEKTWQKTWSSCSAEL